MQIQRVKFLACVLILAVVFVTSPEVVAAQETASPSSTRAAKPETGSPMTISDLIAGSTELSRRLSTLERNLQLAYDSAGFGVDVGEIEEHLKELTVRLSEMKADGRLGYERLSSLKAEMLASQRKLKDVWKPFDDRIRQVEGWNQAWAQDNERVKSLESSLSADESYKTMKPTIDRAKNAIDKARKLISTKLDALLAMQDKGGTVQGTADSLVAEVDDLLGTLRSDLFERTAPAMFSSTYFDEFNTALWEDLKKGFQFVSVPQWNILQRNAPFLFFQLVLCLFIALMIIRNRAALAAEPRLVFITERPFSAGVLFGFLVFMPFYETSLGIWGTGILAVVAICVARLSGCCIVGPWKRWAVYGLLIVLILNEFLQLSDFPQPLFRMYVLLVSIVGLLLCSWRLMNLAPDTEARLRRWALWGGVALSGTTIAANLIGFSALAAHLIEASLRTVMIVLVGWVLMASGRGGLEWLFKSAPATRVPLLQKNAATIVHVSSRLLNLLVGAFLSIRILVAWGLYDDGVEAWRSVMSVGFTIGSWRVDLGPVLTGFLALYCAHLISRTLQSILVEEIFPRRRVERGVRVSINSLLHYAVLLVGFLVALAILGVNFTNITIIGGALGVGIGFGLQTIVNNFVSGLILLFERPIRVGDYVEVGGLWAEVKKIGLRATVVESFDRADVIVPNSDFISNQVTNWTRSNRIIRLRLPVGVAYGSDVPLVMKILLECARDNPSVVSEPKPQVLFTGFGDSSLNFELRAHILDIDYRLITQSEILEAIDSQFREKGVQIPFPQRDLHLRSVDEKAGKSLLGKAPRASSHLDTEETE